MIERIDTQPTRQDKEFDQRSGEERRKTHTMINPEMERRVGERRRKS